MKKDKQVDHVKFIVPHLENIHNIALKYKPYKDIIK